MPLHRHEKAEHRRTLAERPQMRGDDDIGIPRARLSEHGMAPRAAYQAVHDELLLDGNARLNVATFVTTWMEDEAIRLISECFEKNMIDKDEYPQTAELERRCVNILADLWHASDAEAATGCSTIGSSEACMLAGLAMKWRWRERRRAAGSPADRPNLVMGANVQVCWEKFCRYWDVEARLVPVTAAATHLTAERAAAHCDENTIGVVAILGSTFDGSYEPVADIAAALDGLQERSGLDVPVHVDAASGGFVAPFVDEELRWDFLLPRVRSINASGHKYGLVYPGVGWVIWRDRSALPEELVFHVDYLGGDMPTFALNFSRPGAQIAGQYYNLVRLGRSGYRRVQQASRDVATWLAAEVGAMGPFVLLSDGGALPVFAFRLRDGVDAYTVYDVSETIRERGWTVPAYRMPPDMEEVSILRVVVRNGFSRDLAVLLRDDLAGTVAKLDRAHRIPSESAATAFHH